MYIWVGGKCLCWPLNMLHLLEAEKPKYAFLFYSISPLPLDGSNGPNQRIYIQSWACVSEMLSRLCAFFKWCRLFVHIFTVKFRAFFVSRHRVYGFTSRIFAPLRIINFQLLKLVSLFLTTYKQSPNSSGGHHVPLLTENRPPSWRINPWRTASIWVMGARYKRVVGNLARSIWWTMRRVLVWGMGIGQ